MDAIAALQPVTRVFQLFGLSVVSPFQRAKFSTGWIIKVYSLLLTALRIGIIVSTLLTQVFFVRRRSNKDFESIDIILVYGVRFLEIANSIEAFFKVDQEKQLIKNFMEIDKILMNRFNIDLKSSELKSSALKRLLIWFCTFASTLGGSLVLILIQNGKQEFLFYLTYMQPFWTVSLTYFQIIIWADLIRYRLHIVNRLICDLNNYDQNEIDKTKRKPMIPQQQRLCISDLFESEFGHFYTAYDARLFYRIRKFCDLHRRLWIQTNLVNERFKCSMVLNIGNELIALVSNLYFTFICLTRDCLTTSTAAYFMTSIIHILHVSMLSRTCHHATNEASNIAYGLHNNKCISSNARLGPFVCIPGIILPQSFQHIHRINYE